MDMPPKLKAILDSLEDFQSTYPDDACLILCDREENIIGYVPGKKVDLKLKVGENLVNYSQSVMAKVFRTGQALREERGAEFMGFAYISNAKPVLEAGELIGVLAAVISNQKFDTLRTGAHELTALVEEMTATTDHVTQASSEITNRLQQLSDESVEVTENTNKVSAILQLVQEIATQSHLLGLNAAIEAARAGEHGRGFSVVAEEIRKMSDNSNLSIKEVKEELQLILKAIEQMNQQIQEISALTEEHAASMQQLNAAFQQISAMADQLMNAADMH